MGYNITKYQNKTAYRLKSNIEKFVLFLQEEEKQKIKKGILGFYVMLEKEKNRSERKEWLQNWVFIYSYFLQKIYLKKYYSK